MKQLLADFPIESLRFFAGEEGARLPDDARVTLLRQEQVSPRLERGFREVDSLLLVEKEGGEEEAVVFLVEEESRPTRAAAYKVAEYVLLIGQWLERERPTAELVPVIVFVGDGASQTAIQLGTKLRKYLTFDCIACRLAELDAEEALRSGNLAAAAQVMNMEYPAEQKVALCAAALVLWRRKVADDTTVAKYANYITGCARMTHNERVELRGVLARSEEGRMAMGIMEIEWLKGEAEGLAKGVLQGRAEGKAEAVLDMLEARGMVPNDAARQRIQECRDVGMLRRWLVRAATATTVEQIFADS